MKIIRLFLASSLWFSFIFSACQPIAVANIPESTSTEESRAIADLATPTEALEILLTVTFTQAVDDCTGDNRLPDPDIPENYIGWKPGVDLANFYKKENGEVDYVYWETLLNGYNDFVVAGYRRSDNTYMIFLEKAICRNTNNGRVYEIVDAIRTRSLSEYEVIAPPSFECYRFGQDGAQEQVFAIVNKTTNNAVLAWSIDVQSQNIQETSLKAISCFPFGIHAPSK